MTVTPVILPEPSAPGDVAISPLPLRPSLDPPVGTQDHLRGSLGAQLTLVEYGDFECPYCRAAAPVIDEVRRRLGERLCFAFRHFPLAGFHPFALSAAVGAEAAALYGQFWPMHDLLYTGAPRLRQADLRRYAAQIGVDPDLVVWPATRMVEDRVEADFNSGVRSGVRGTPALFISGLPYDGVVTADALTAALDASADPPPAGRR
ncbi:MAG TPA: thioredoxin domain-containing protein [Pseudonocardiaceae bacterium]|nr:thioredoxin domain-containing protein [Pseudonocardiaceae bacterium]